MLRLRSIEKPILPLDQDEQEEGPLLHVTFEGAAGVALCISDHHDAPSPWVVTARHVYVRGHGPGGSYRGSYSARTLSLWAESIAAWVAQRRNVFVYFDNDQKAAAPGDARRLISLLPASASDVGNG